MANEKLETARTAPIPMPKLGAGPIASQMADQAGQYQNSWATPAAALGGGVASAINKPLGDALPTSINGALARSPRAMESGEYANAWDAVPAQVALATSQPLATGRLPGAAPNVAADTPGAADGTELKFTAKPAVVPREGNPDAVTDALTQVAGSIPPDLQGSADDRGLSYKDAWERAGEPASQMTDEQITAALNKEAAGQTPATETPVDPGPTPEQLSLQELQDLGYLSANSAGNETAVRVATEQLRQSIANGNENRSKHQTLTDADRARYKLNQYDNQGGE